MMGSVYNSGAMMFTLDEGDDETVYSESFKSSMKSQSLSTAHFTYSKDANAYGGGAVGSNFGVNRINFVKKLRSREDPDEVNEDDELDDESDNLEPDDD